MTQSKKIQLANPAHHIVPITCLVCALVPSSAFADCALSNDDKTKTCAGDITSGESFPNDDIKSALGCVLVKP